MRLFRFGRQPRENVVRAEKQQVKTLARQIFAQSRDYPASKLIEFYNAASGDIRRHTSRRKASELVSKMVLNDLRAHASVCFELDREAVNALVDTHMRNAIGVQSTQCIIDTMLDSSQSEAPSSMGEKLDKYRQNIKDTMSRIVSDIDTCIEENRDVFNRVGITGEGIRLGNLLAGSPVFRRLGIQIFLLSAGQERENPANIQPANQVSGGAVAWVLDLIVRAHEAEAVRSSAPAYSQELPEGHASGYRGDARLPAYEEPPAYETVVADNPRSLMDAVSIDRLRQVTLPLDAPSGSYAMRSA